MLRRHSLSLVLAVLVASPAAAQTRLLRTPSVSEHDIAFAYANNIWVVDRAGGVALRLLEENPPQRATTEPPPPTWGRRRTPVTTRAEQ